MVYSVESTTEKIAVFVHDNLFYTISGNVPSTEMKKSSILLKLRNDLDYNHWITVEGDLDIGKFCEQLKTIKVIIYGEIV
ncbi:hypothetical protein PACILC2_27720 [Paenibacillus cisolokensis]|uniref:Uncharacterized protein n=1 Tax=Paenibacillus cisolokensis TaxID=1658519 RepID=A0ABQ4N8C5_9BACL|nr:hypothetical protein PACILC2_27720 [Paenibacillus cisolokensis]